MPIPEPSLLSFRRLFAFAAAVFTSAGAAAAPLSPKHPIVGVWRVRVPNTACVEEYRFQPNGKVHVTSAEEVADSRFEIAADPDAAGFYRMVDTLEQDNGKPDCSGNVTAVGNKVESWVRFDASGHRFVICAEASLDRCIGPFERLLGQSS